MCRKIVLLFSIIFLLGMTSYVSAETTLFTEDFGIGSFDKSQWVETYDDGASNYFLGSTDIPSGTSGYSARLEDDRYETDLTMADGLDTSDAIEITITFWTKRSSSGGTNNGKIYFNEDGAASTFTEYADYTPTADTWVQQSVTLTDSKYMFDGFKVRLSARTKYSDTVRYFWFDEVVVTMRDAIEITGKITDSDNIHDMDGVVMSGLPGSPVTDANGNYSATVDSGWSGTVTPTKTGFTFDPANTVYSNVTASQNDDYDAYVIKYTISGSVGSVEGVELDGFPDDTPTTDASGNYSTEVEYGWSGTATPQKEGYTFSPTERTYSNLTSNQTSQDYTPTLVSCTISGYVGSLAGVTMTGLTGSPVTDSSGYYVGTVDCGWSGTVVPEKAGYEFDPVQRTYSNVAANYSDQDFTPTSTFIDINLVGWWRLNGDANDYSGYGYHGTVTGGQFVSSEMGTVLDFEGSDYVSIPPSVFSSITDKVSVSLWQYGDTALQPQNDSIFFAADSSGNRVIQAHLPWGSGTVYLDAGNTGSSYDRMSKSATPDEYEGQWNHWVFTKDATTGEMKMYLNGSLWDSDTGKTRTMGTVAQFKIGSKYDGTNNYDGMISDFRIYDRVLSDTEIYDLYYAPYQSSNPSPANGAVNVSLTTDLSWTAGCLADSHNVYFGTNFDDVNSGIPAVSMGNQSGTTFDPGTLEGGVTYYWAVDEVNGLNANSPWTGEVWSFTTMDPNLVGYWNFDDETAKDSSAYGRDGTMVGDARIVNKALKLDGTGDYVQITGYKGVTGTKSRTTCAWIKADVTDDTLTVASWGTSSSGEQWVLRVDSTNLLRLGVSSGYVISSTPVGDGQWHHVAAVMTDDGSPNANEVTLYIDGIEETSYSAVNSQSINTGSSEDVCIGSWETGNYFQGYIDEVRIYDRVLSSAEIWNLYNTENAENPSPEDKDWNVSLTPTLSWTPGQNVGSYGQELYVGTDYDLVSTRDASVYVGALDVNSSSLSTLKLYKQYYWAVDIVDTDNAIWYGDVWSFKTRHVQTQTEGYYMDYFLAGGAGIAAYESLYATENLGLTGEFSENPTLDGYVGTYYLMSEIDLGNWDDDNGVLLYPDGEPRYRMMYCGGGASVTFAENMLAPDGSGRVDAQDRAKEYYAKGGSYVGNCAGAALAFEILGVSGRADIFWQFFDDFKGEFTNLASTYTDYEIPDGVTERQGYILPKSPLLKYYDFGGDYYINSVRQNGGNWCRWWDPSKYWPWGVAEVLTVYNDKIDGEVVREGYKTTDGASCWAYKRNDESGRMAPCGGHPEGVETGERLELESALFAYAIDGAGCPVVKAALTDGVTRQMDDNATAGYEKIGDRQYHHFTIDVPQGATELEIVLDGDLYDLNLYAKHEDFAFYGEPDIVTATNGSGCDETITIEDPTPGTWYVGVKCVTVPTRTKHSKYWEYTGNLETQNGLAYDITATID